MHFNYIFYIWNNFFSFYKLNASAHDPAEFNYTYQNAVTPSYTAPTTISSAESLYGMPPIGSLGNGYPQPGPPPPGPPPPYGYQLQASSNEYQPQIPSNGYPLQGPSNGFPQQGPPNEYQPHSSPYGFPPQGQSDEFPPAQGSHEHRNWILYKARDSTFLIYK